MESFVTDGRTGLKYELVGDSYLTGGELSACLADIDRQAEALFLRIVKQMADAEGITETLKASDQMKWVGRMNSCRDRASARPVDPICPVHLYTYCFLRE